MSEIGLLSSNNGHSIPSRIKSIQDLAMRGFFYAQNKHKTCCYLCSELHVYSRPINDQRYINIMLKQIDMTEEAKIVLEVVPHSWWATIEEISSYTELAKSRCQLILTQLAMAGFIKENIEENTFQNI